MTTYRIDELAKLASEQGVECRRVDDNRVDVMLASNVVLVFCNLVDENDTLVGFDGTPWHSHGVVPFMTGADTYVECDELEILIALGTGDLLILSKYLLGELKDRWLAHRDEPLDLQAIEAGEELRALRLDLDRARRGGSTC